MSVDLGIHGINSHKDPEFPEHEQKKPVCKTDIPKPPIKHINVKATYSGSVAENTENTFLKFHPHSMPASHLTAQRKQMQKRPVDR